MNKIEWKTIAQYFAVIVTTPHGERIVHSSKNRRYLEKLVAERYTNPHRTA